MQFSIFATISAALLTYSANVYAQETILSSPLPTTTANTYTTTTTQGVDCFTLPTCVITGTGICTTITTQGINCPTLSTCIVPDCLRIVQITLLCGCPSIFTSTTCATACPTGCAGTSYKTFALPCSTTASTSTSENSITSSKPTTSTTVTSTQTSPTPMTSASSTFATANSAKKWKSDSALSGLIVAILGLLWLFYVLNVEGNVISRRLLLYAGISVVREVGGWKTGLDLGPVWQRNSLIILLLLFEPKHDEIIASS